MDIQGMIDELNSAMRDTRKDYHVTLDGLIEALEKCKPDAPVTFEDGTSPGHEYSYRGYYSDLCFCPRDEHKTASELLTQCRRARGEIYEGYKGGNYHMDGDTPLWCADYGDCGPAIVAVAHTEDNGGLVLICKQVD